MINFVRKCVTSMALVAVAFASTAQASCWTPQALEAAEVRNLDTMLMVASLRCRISGRDFTAGYNGFVRENRPLLVEANDQLRSHFENIGGPNAYDRYVTSIANRHGGGTAGQSCSEMEQLINEARDEGDTLGKLAKLARMTGSRPPLPGEICPTTYAKAR